MPGLVVSHHVHDMRRRKGGSLPAYGGNKTVCHLEFCQSNLAGVFGFETDKREVGHFTFWGIISTLKNKGRKLAFCLS